MLCLSEPAKRTTDKVQWTQHGGGSHRFDFWGSGSFEAAAAASAELQEHTRECYDDLDMLMWLRWNGSLSWSRVLDREDGPSTTGDFSSMTLSSQKHLSGSYLHTSS
jgi:hypothetical protein